MTVSVGDLLVTIRADTSKLVTGMTDAVGSLKKLQGTLSTIASAVRHNYLAIAAFVTATAFGFKRAVDTVIGFDYQARASFERISNEVLPNWYSFLDNIVTAVLPILDQIVTQFINPLLDNFNKLITGAETPLDFLKNMFTIGSNAGSGIAGFLGDVYSKIISWAQSVDWSQVWQGFFDFTTHGLDNALNFLGKMLNSFITWFKNIDWPLLWHNVFTWTAKIAEYLGELVGKLGHFLLYEVDWIGLGLGIAKAIISGIFQLLGNLPNILNNFMNGLMTGSGSRGGSNYSIPPTASGGIVTSPQIRMVGEAGPEAIIPLSQAGGIGGTVVLNISAPSIDARNQRELFQKWMDMASDEYKRRFSVR